MHALLWPHFNVVSAGTSTIKYSPQGCISPANTSICMKQVVRADSDMVRVRSAVEPQLWLARTDPVKLETRTQVND